MACKLGPSFLTPKSVSSSAFPARRHSCRADFADSKTASTSRGDHDDPGRKLSYGVDTAVLKKSLEADNARQSKWSDNYVVREAKLDEELWAAAWLRAECHFEGKPFVRYIENYKKKFAEQEFTSLKRRRLGRFGYAVRCSCFVAVLSGVLEDELATQFTNGNLLESVVGTLDISVRQLLHGEAFPGEISKLVGSALHQAYRYGYVANVCVTESYRCHGIGSNLLRTAIGVGKDWGLKELYVHVNSTNCAAHQLYVKHGFQVVEEANSNQPSVEQTLLLCLEV